MQALVSRLFGDSVISATHSVVRSIFCTSLICSHSVLPCIPQVTRSKGKDAQGSSGPDPLVEDDLLLDLPASSSGPDGTPAATGGAVQRVELFGEWQTVAWRPPAARDGRVPKDEWGHVELWSPACLPPGTAHLPAAPGLVAVVQRLGFDFAPAMVGFDRRNGRTVPKFDGLVVCLEHAGTILDVSGAQCSHCVRVCLSVGVSLCKKLLEHCKAGLLLIWIKHHGFLCLIVTECRH